MKLCARQTASQPDANKNGSRASKRSLRGDVRSRGDFSNVAEPPVLSPRLDGCDPAAKRIEGDDNGDPDHIDPRQADAEAFWKVAKAGEELLCRKALRDSEHD